MAPWPWSGDTREEKARRVALSYRRLAQQSPELAEPLAELDARWAELGANWVAPTPMPLDLDDWLTAGQLAELLAIDAHDLRNWAARGHIRAVATMAGFRRYCVGDVVSYQRTRRRPKSAVTPVK